MIQLELIYHNYSLIIRFSGGIAFAWYLPKDEPLSEVDNKKPTDCKA